MTKAKKKKQSKPSSRSSRPKRKDLDTSSYEPVEVEAANLKEADFEKIEQAGHVKLDGNARYEINMEIQTMLSMQKIEETAFRREEIRFALESLLKNLSGLYGFLTSKSETAEAKAEDKISDQLCVMNYDGLYKKIDKPKYSKDLNPPMHRLIDGDKRANV
ncbi:MAG: hypothetical protein H3C49_08540 [Alphaproteobacteria bacterium]|nr:hypothetical protein [Alphaproteobacteria bacterium]